MSTTPAEKWADLQGLHPGKIGRPLAIEAFRAGAASRTDELLLLTIARRLLDEFPGVAVKFEATAAVRYATGPPPGQPYLDASMCLRTNELGRIRSPLLCLDECIAELHADLDFTAKKGKG